jgi:hypothetical protein
VQAAELPRPPCTSTLSLGVPRSTASLLTFLEVGRNPMQIQWLARTVRYWNKLVDLVQQGPSLLGSTFLANVGGLRPGVRQGQHLGGRASARRPAVCSMCSMGSKQIKASDATLNQHQAFPNLLVGST